MAVVPNTNTTDVVSEQMNRIDSIVREKWISLYTWPHQWGFLIDEYRLMNKAIATHDLKLLLSKPTEQAVKLDPESGLYLPTAVSLPSTSNKAPSRSSAAGKSSLPSEDSFGKLSGDEVVEKQEWKAEKYWFPRTTHQMLGWRQTLPGVPSIDPYGSDARPMGDINKALGWPAFG